MYQLQQNSKEYSCEKQSERDFLPEHVTLFSPHLASLGAAHKRRHQSRGEEGLPKDDLIQKK